MAILSTIAALIWGASFETAAQAPLVPVPVIEQIRFDARVAPHEAPVEIRIGGSKPDVCYAVSEPSVDVDAAAEEIRVTVDLTKGDEKPCLGRGARFRLVSVIPEVEAGVYTVFVNGLEAKQQLVVE